MALNLSHNAFLSGTLGSAILSGILGSIHQGSHGKSDQSTPESDAPERLPGAFITCVTRLSSAERLKADLKQYLHYVDVLQNENLQGVQRADVVLLACKPQKMRDIVGEEGMREALAGKLLISILAGVPVEQIEETLYGPGSAVTGPESRCRIVVGCPRSLIPDPWRNFSTVFSLNVDPPSYAYTQNTLAKPKIYPQSEVLTLIALAAGNAKYSFAQSRV